MHFLRWDLFVSQVEVFQGFKVNPKVCLCLNKSMIRGDCLNMDGNFGITLLSPNARYCTVILYTKVNYS